MQQFVWTQNIYSSSEAATTAFPVTTQQVACCGDSCLIFSLQFNIRYLRAFIILIWRYLHFNCLLLGENYLLLTCVPIHETVSGNPILLGGSDGPNLLKLVCVVASPRPQHRVGEKFGLISDLSSDQPLFKLSWVLLKDGKHEPNISSEWRWMDPLLMGQVGETKLGELGRELDWME